MKNKIIYLCMIALFLISADGCDDVSIKKIYPNPVDQELQVELDTEFLTAPIEVEFQITNMNGQVVKSGIFNSDLNSIECSDLQPGYYILTLLNTEESSKFIKK